MKKFYEMPELELMKFSVADILTNSEVPDVPDISDEGDGDWDFYA